MVLTQLAYANPLIAKIMYSKQRMITITFTPYMLQSHDLNYSIDLIQNLSNIIYLSKSKDFIKHLFASRNGVNWLHMFPSRTLDKIKQSPPNAAILCACYTWLHILRTNIIRYEQAILKLLGDKEVEHQILALEVIGGYTELYDNAEEIEILECVTRYQRLRTYSKIKCGNIDCKINYLDHKYGTNFSIDRNILDLENDSHYNDYDVAAISKDTNEKWKRRERINKWYICKGCKCVRYCSKRCQKISWNIYDHKKQCVKIQQNCNKYF